MHCQIWVEELSGKIRQSLFIKSRSEKRDKARKEFYDYIDTIMSSSYSTKLDFTHNCLATREGEIKIPDKFYDYIDTIMSSSYSTKLDFTHNYLATREGEIKIPDNITEREIQLFRDARNETLCGDEERRLLKCRRCNFRRHSFFVKR
jgi:hypothetical protein